MVKPTVESVQEMVVNALIAVGVHDAVEVGEIPVQVHVVGVLAPEEKVLAALEIPESFRNVGIMVISGMCSTRLDESSHVLSIYRDS